MFDHIAVAFGCAVGVMAVLAWPCAASAQEAGAGARGGGVEHVVTSPAEVEATVARARPGDVIVLNDGEWKDAQISFTGRGTAEAPITLRAQTAGKVVLSGDSSITIDGDHLVVSGLYFPDSDTTRTAITIRGNDNRVTETAIIAPNRGGKWIHFRGGQRNRMDHCWIEGHAPKDVTLQIEIEEHQPNYHRIDHNYFGPRPPLGENGGEIMRIGYSHQQTRISRTVVEHNLFDRCDGELEIISSKSCENIYRYNTFLHCEGTITLRHGDRCIVDGNYFIGSPSGRSGGVRVIGAGNTVINNYFENCAPLAGGVIALTCGIVDSPPTGYTQVDGGMIAFNTFVNCGLPYLRLDAGYDEGRNRVLIPKDVIVANNLMVVEGGSGGAFVQGREGENFRWIGNIGWGAEAGSAGGDGIRKVDPMMERGEDGVLRPAAASPARGSAMGDFAEVKTDIDGQARDDGARDVGADQLSDAAPGRSGPIRRGDVGPSWQAPPPQPSPSVLREGDGEGGADDDAELVRPEVSIQHEVRRATADEAAHARVTARIEGEPMTLESQGLRVQLEPGDGRLRVSGRGADGWQASSVALCAEIVAHPAVAERVEHRDVFGAADAIEIRSTVGSQRIWIHEGQPFVFTRVQVRNTAGAPQELRTITPLVFEVQPAAGMDQVRLFGADGLGPAGRQTGMSGPPGKASYVFLAAVEPGNRSGLVAGWITHERGSGIVEARNADGKLIIEARGEYGRLPVAPSAEAEGETFAIGFFDDARLGLEVLADVTAAVHEIQLPPVPSGYSTWYHARALDEQRMARLAEFVTEQRLQEYGFDFLQIDDQWQLARRDFTTHRPNGPYPSGMKQTADTIRGHGLTAGLWITPFGWDSSRETVQKDWFVKRRADGEVYEVRWAGDCLDMSHPEGRQLLHDVIRQMTEDWGYSFLKIDGLWAGMAVSILYPNPAYRDDGLGDAVFYDETKTNIEVYRDGLRLLREAAGEETYLLGCNIAQNMRTMGASMGLVDGMRVGPDIGAEWGRIVRCARPAGRLWFWHGRVWHNDPDCLMLRDPLTLDQARLWGSWIGISGQMMLVSEWLPDLSPEKFNILKRVIPNHGRKSARPVDIFEHDMPRIWQVTAEGFDRTLAVASASRRDVIGLFNWDADNHATITIDPAALGLPSSEQDRYIGFDYWEDEFVPAFSGAKEFELRPSSSRVIALQRQLDRPQLLGTSRHVTQGLVDLVEVRWDPDRGALVGKSQLVGGDEYELRIASAGRQVSAAVVSADDAAAGVSVASPEVEGEGVRVRVMSPETRTVAWEVRFGN